VTFAVTSCPRCGRLKITQIPSKTTECPWCGKKYTVGQTSQRAYETLAQARLALAAITSGGNVEATGIPTEVPVAKTAGRTPIERLTSMAESLAAENGDFGEEEFAARAKAEGIANPQSALKKLIDCGGVYEVRAGRYKPL
jgi:uncharacterized Zn finger protein (UPF0148 family)